METSFDVLKDKYPNATLNFSVDKFDTFLHHLKKMIREEFDLQYKAMKDVSTRTLNRWQSQGYLVPVMIGGQRRYKRSDIERVISESSQSDNSKILL